MVNILTDNNIQKLLAALMQQAVFALSYISGTYVPDLFRVS
jgi:hypothetical protein